MSSDHLNRCFDRREFLDLGLAAHRVRQASADEGVEQLSTLAAELEDACWSRNIDRIGDALAATVDYLEETGV